jgi:predicted nucleotidyltransferase
MKERLKVLLQALQGYHPQRVILFGSTARGDTDAASDLDVLVVKDTEEPFVHRLETMAELCPPGIHADILVYTPEEITLMVADKNPFILRALAEGKVVYEAKS